MKKEPGTPTSTKKLSETPDSTEKVQIEMGILPRQEPGMDWEAVFRAIGSPAVILSPGYDIISANKTTCRITGKTETELRRMKCWEVFHGRGEACPAPGCPMAQLLSSRKHETVEMEVAINNGISLVSCTPILDTRGTISSVIHIATDITEKKKTERILLENEERFRKIFENTPLGMALVTPDFRFFSVNPAWVSITGYSEEELLKMSFRDITHPDHLASDMEHIRDLADGRISVYRTEKRYIKKDSSILWGSLLVTAVRDQQGSLRHFTAQIEDITDRKRTEQELLLQNCVLETINQLAVEFASLSSDKSVTELAAKKLMQLSGAVITCFSVYDPVERILQLTNLEIVPGMLEKAITLLGKRPGDMKIPVSAVMYREIVSNIVGVRKTLTEVSFGEIPLFISTSIQKMTGIDHCIGIAYVIEGELYGTSILAIKQGQPDPSPELLESFAHIVAVSLRRYRAEETLSESEEKYRSLYLNSVIGIFHSSFKGRFIDVNPALAKMLGYDSPEEVVTSVTNMAEQVYAELPRYDAVSKDVLNAGGRLSTENLYRRRDGTLWYGMLHLRIVPDPQGRPSHYEGFVEDITERKQVEEQREVLIRELARKNAELDRFTYTVSHDLKSPLVGIRAFLALLEKDVKSNNIQEIQTDIARISGSAEKLEILITTLLSLSRSGRTVDLPVRIQFSDLAREAAGLLGKTFQESGVRMVISDDMPSVSGDMVRLRQVMTNLLENAVKFMGGQKEPRVEVGNRNDAGETVFFVRDNGIGIKKENLQKVFGLFERFNPEIPGTGVGLATVKRIIEAHGGKIWTESEGEGKGTTVCFTLTVVPELSPAIKIIMGK